MRKWEDIRGYPMKVYAGAGEVAKMMFAMREKPLALFGEKQANFREYNNTVGVSWKSLFASETV